MMSHTIVDIWMEQCFEWGITNHKHNFIKYQNRKWRKQLTSWHHKINFILIFSTQPFLADLILVENWCEPMKTNSSDDKMMDGHMVALSESSGERFPSLKLKEDPCPY